MVEIVFRSKQVCTYQTSKAHNISLKLSYDGTKWTETNEPRYQYDYDATNMAIYKDKPVMIGGEETYDLDEIDDVYSWRSNASYFETFDPDTEEWSDLNRNPFFDEWTRWYWEGTSVTKEDSFLIFGGRIGIYTDKSSEIFLFQ